jgi:phosphoenolpyruvate phosphomutase
LNADPIVSLLGANMTVRYLRQMFGEPGLIRLAGAHDALGARLIEASGFEGVWASSLEISTSRGVADAGILTMTEMLAQASLMAEAVRVPVVADCEAGFGGEDQVAHLVRRYERAGIAAVCIADAQFPMRNSLLDGRQQLATVAEFCAKLSAARAARRDPDFLLLARVEALIAGRGLDEALRRAHAYRDAGADAILIHSRSQTPAEIMEFVAAWDGSLPLVLVPTTYHSLTAREMARSGKVKMVIYANHGLRAAIAAMRRVFAQILADGTAHHAEEWIPGLADVFALQGLAHDSGEAVS